MDTFGKFFALPEMSEKDGVKVAELEMEFSEMDGYMAESSASELLLGLDIPEDQHYKPPNRSPSLMPTVPLVGVNSPVKIFIKVDLPQPFAPIKP
jgi:hypothetical protein